MTLPPYDIDLKPLNRPRLQDLASGMGLSKPLEQWIAGKTAFDRAPGTRRNAPGA
jgi:hypothetical protein